MQNLGDVTSWVRMDTDMSLPFEGSRSRVVVIDVNTPEITMFAIQPRGVDDDGVEFEGRFLARVVGYDTVKFNVPAGAFDLFRIDGGTHAAHVRTADGEKQHRDNIGLEKFTEIHVRRELSPEYQYVLDQVQKNAMRNMEMMGGEIQRLRREVNANRPVSASPVSASNPPPSQQSPAPTDEGDGTGTEGQGGSEGGS